MCPWVGPHVPSFGRQLWGLLIPVEYLSPQGVLLPLVYGRTTSPLWLELRGLSAWQAAPSWTVYRLACHQLLPCLWLTFAMVPNAAWPGWDQRPWGTAPAAGPVGRLGRPSVSDPWGVSSFLSLGRPSCARVCGVLGHLAPVHRCARSVRCFACAVSWAIGSCSPVCPLGVLCCLCGVLGHLALVHRCARSVRCFAGAVSWATWLLFTGVPARCVALLVRCPGPLGSCSPVCTLGALLCPCGVPGHLASVHRCARSLCCVARAVLRATSLLFTVVPARCIALRLRCPGQLGSCSTVCALRPLLCLCGVLDPLAPVHRCARLLCRVACAVSWATWLLFTGVRAPSVALLVRCSWPLGSCSPVCPLGVLCCVCGVLGYLAPVHRCARLVRCFVCAVSTATWLQFTGVPARCVVLGVQCPGPLGSCSPVCSFGVLCCGVRSTLEKRRRNHKRE